MCKWLVMSELCWQCRYEPSISPAQLCWMQPRKLQQMRRMQTVARPISALYREEKLHSLERSGLHQYKPLIIYTSSFLLQREENSNLFSLAYADSRKEMCSVKLILVQYPSLKCSDVKSYWFYRIMPDLFYPGVVWGQDILMIYIYIF